MHVLVVGCGWLGAEVARVAAVRGDQVTAVRRDAGRSAALRDLGVALCSLDVSIPGAASRLPRADAVIACQSAETGSVAAYRAAYLSVNAEVLSMVARCGARMVYTGSTGVFGQADGADVDESSPPTPASATAEVLLQAEESITRAARGGIHACVLRLSGLYGPGRAGILERVRSGRLSLGPGDDVWMNFCHRADAVQLALAALAQGRPGGTYHGSDEEPTRKGEVVSWVARALGVSPHRDGAPAEGPSRRILSSWTRRTLGVELAYRSFREGLAPLVEAELGAKTAPAALGAALGRSGE
ncbi:MAG TPA: NAD-dependent epimerase/dehydratase family protein [Anaeromyxobacter sp.]|nr:NAD-dependent epimerase/dehydratase family protein [Anaeromyxobacter sp.]